MSRWRRRRSPTSMNRSRGRCPTVSSRLPEPVTAADVEMRGYVRKSDFMDLLGRRFTTLDRDNEGFPAPGQAAEDAGSASSWNTLAAGGANTASPTLATETAALARATAGQNQHRT